MQVHTHRWIVVAAIVSLGAGAALSHVIEAGVRVEKIMLTTNTPALRLFPATPGPHPKALLAHGCTGSKEMLFRFGEALAAAGFDCYSVDQAGHGESPQPFSRTNILLGTQEFERALGAVDVFIGHSMGGAVGAWSVREAGFRPKLFIGVGAPVKLGEHGPPELLLAGLFEELHRPARSPARATWTATPFPMCWSVHPSRPAAN
jgi:pimeloyl-ACP methyl ester carboxylesterase